MGEVGELHELKKQKIKRAQKISAAKKRILARRWMKKSGFGKGGKTT
ncbi:hypothetical protein IMZ48_09795 [Candidatus Bathyarchaeota archaeon]|nr:hypothetical protein [Candidatus Bathyarchaeota archaeon]